jgi:cysteine desulfurase
MHPAMSAREPIGNRMSRTVYLDHAATTPLHPRALEAMLPHLGGSFGNPSATYALAKAAAAAVAQARQTVAGILGCRPVEVVFTGGGTESINTAIKGVAFQQKLAGAGNHIVTSAIEHHAVLHTCQYLERFGFDVTYLPVDQYGIVEPDDVARAITPQTVLVSIMTANNEVGTVEPVFEIARAVRERATQLHKRVPFHTDAVQAPNSMRMDFAKHGVDLLSLAAHKFRGPKGVGVLYIRKGVPFLAQQNGGGQERQRRAGTENVAGIVGLSEALRITQDELDPDRTRIGALATRLREQLLSTIPGSMLNGHPEQRLVNNVSISFDGADARDLLEDLDAQGIALSAGAACGATTLEPSHVLLAMGVPLELAAATLRFSLGHDTTDADIDYVLAVLPGVIERSRRKRFVPAK